MPPRACSFRYPFATTSAVPGGSREGRRRETERMKPLKSPPALLLLAGLFSINAHAGAVSPDLHSGMRGGDERAVRSSDGGASRVDGIDCMSNPERCLHKAAWYQDRDNSMSPVSTKKGVGAAMASVFTKNGVGQGIQVCPGVYLATAHGVLDNPKEARREERPQETPSGNTHGMSPYPLSRETVMTAKNDSSYVSPRIGNPSAWTDSSTDYVFIKVVNPLKPNHFVRPVRGSNQRLIDASIRGEIDVHLYRPQTIFYKDESGTPIFSKGYQAKTFKQTSFLYDAPMRVNKPCQTVQYYEGLIGSDCPSEKGVSGSPKVTSINGQDYLVGMHIEGNAISEESFEKASLPNAFVPSSHFCDDYESVCGQPCAELDEVLPQ